MGKYDDARFAFLDGDAALAVDQKATTTDVGPEARRARAGLPVAGGTTDPDPGGMQYPGRRIVGGGATTKPQTSTDTRILDLPPEDRKRLEFEEGVRFRPQTELEGDPGAQAITATALTAPIAGPLAAGAARVAGPVAGRAAIPAVGAAQGGAVSKMSGGSFKEGAAIGGLFALAPALAGVGRAMATRGVMKDIGITQDLAPNASAAELEQLRRVGYAKTAETARKYGVVGAKDPVLANESVRAGKATVGDEIGQVYSTLGSEYAPELGNLMKRMDVRQQSLRGTRAGNDIADAIHDEMRSMYDVHGGTAQSKITLGTLRRELTDSQKAGYSGAKFQKLPDKAKAVVEREIADVLRAELDAGLERAGADPRFASTVSRIPELNGTYRALKVLDEVTSRMIDKATRRGEPTLMQRARMNIPESAQDVKMPSGNRMGRLGLAEQPPEVGAAISPGLGNALAAPERKNETIEAEMRRTLFGGGE